jgi:hypothetical protein
MSHSWEEIICIYTNDVHVIAETEKFAEKYGFKVCIADSETDLIAIPYWLSVIDINLLRGEYFGFLEEVDRPLVFENIKEIFGEEKISILEKIITHTKPKSVPDWLSKYLIVEENITVEFLESCCHSFMQIKGLDE